eukprot:283543-Amphidinium_carterae.1
MAPGWSSGTAPARLCQMTTHPLKTGLPSSRVARSPSTSSSSSNETVWVLSQSNEKGQRIERVDLHARFVLLPRW